MPLIHFLIVYNRHTRDVAYREFDDADEASAAYVATERSHRGEDDIEVVLLGADSIETIRQTHSNYFEHDDLPFAAAR
ncbi:MAG TPA: hypothetical protein VHC01_02085 [Gaiellaceae bacterium]|nr:hypothetical protein [Gaiellaceae bacterium]